MQVLVTGGAGFIGSHSVEALLAAGHRVRVLDNLSSGKQTNLPLDRALELQIGDIRDMSAVTTAMQSVDAVLHLAAQVSVQDSLNDPGKSCGINILGFANVLEAARRSRVRRIVYASSAAVYGDPAYLPLDEKAPLRPISPYGLEKRVDEQYAELFGRLYGLSTLGLRYFNVYGPRQDPASPYAGVISLFVSRAMAGHDLRIFGNGLQTRDFVYVADIAQANLAALGVECTGAANVATGRTVSLLELVATLEKLLGRSLPVEHQPARTGDIEHSSALTEHLNQCLAVVPKTSLHDGLARLLASLEQPERVLL